MTQNILFTPAQLGALHLKHRIVLPPLSRLRGNWPDGTPSDIMIEYYRQRASDGGLVVIESNAVSPEGRPYHTMPGLWNDEQVTEWKKVVHAIHGQGGVAVVQLTHAGRTTSEKIGGVAPVTSSVDQTFLDNKNIVVTTPDGFTSPSPHRALEIAEIHGIVGQFRVAAENAKRAGFDGIEILAGQGHLVEQFLHDGVNRRTDSYGGSFENRGRFLIEIIEAVSSIIGSDRVGVRISPSSVFAGMGDSDPRALYGHLAVRLNDFGLAYLHIIEPRISGADTVDEGQEPVAATELGQLFKGAIIAAGGFTPETARAGVASGLASAIAIGRYFTSNPDLPYRIKHGLPLAPYDRSTFYAFDAKGYIDFPTYEEENAKARVA